MMKKRIPGFTLSEILIALSVIGVVATLIIPQLVAGQKTAVAKAQFDTAYSSLSKTISDAEADMQGFTNGVIANNDTLLNNLKKYSKFSVDCSSTTTDSDKKSACPKASDYKDVNGKNTSFDINGSFVTQNGATVAVGKFYKFKKNSTGEEKVDYNGVYLFTDINGRTKKPNKFGYDIFVFELNPKDGLKPVTTPPGDDEDEENTSESSITSYCCIPKVVGECTDAGKNSGYACSYFAASDESYFKKLYKGR